MKNLKPIEKALLAFFAFITIALILFTTFYPHKMTKQNTTPEEVKDFRLPRALTVDNVIKKKRNILKFDGTFKDLIGNPELTGSWLVWGDSGNGKTTFVMQLCKYLSQFENVLYDSLEEGNSESIKMALIRVGMSEVPKSKFHLLDMEPIEILKIRLRKRRSPKVVVIDSAQYAGMTYDDYKELRYEFRDKLFIIISHEQGKLPDGKVAQRIRYDSFVKIRVVGYMAFATSRYTEGESIPHTIWKQGAEKYHTDLI
jgi:hypothetical protein